ncbi:maleylacetoacetate isomerase [Nitrincola alkalilacustris]|uniref:maleylacetoacetate isomerase n=1 Tax=Nitrincola alkalilacustris TaxID=1571224 RepID=UPI00124E7FE6|nr:maleylacetoacetate isomerase [Nitrincola alkalilacustris]
MMKLYDYCRSSAAYRVRIALNMKGLEYEQIPVSLLEAEHRSAEHLSRNPQGLVPSLEDKGAIINQSLAIVEYLEERYPDTFRLLPAEPLARARVRSLSQLIACDIHPVNNLRILKYLVSEFGITEEQKTAWYQHWIHAGFQALEQHLTSSDETGVYCQGDSPTLADICLVPQVFNANRFKCDLSDFPTIRRIHAACEELEAFSKAHPDLQPGA